MTRMWSASPWRRMAVRQPRRRSEVIVPRRRRGRRSSVPQPDEVVDGLPDALGVARPDHVDAAAGDPAPCPTSAAT
jgi:hypothetical protein